MIDPFGRHITYLRVSVTDRCDFRCVYCMAEHMSFLPKAELLTLEELERLCAGLRRQGRRAAAHHRRRAAGPAQCHAAVRAAGRADRHGGLKEVTLTTNGSQLARYAQAIWRRPASSGSMSRSTRAIPDKFRAITRWGELAKVLAGIDAAAQAGLKVKINTVALKGVNEDEIRRSDALGAWPRFRPHPDRDHADGRDRRRPRRRNICRCRWCARGWSAISRWTTRDYRTGGPARYVRRGRDRRTARLHHAADPQFLRKLQSRAADLHRHALSCAWARTTAPICARRLRASATTSCCDAAIDAAIARKPKGHDFVIDRRHAAPALARPMSLTGG